MHTFVSLLLFLSTVFFNTSGATNLVKAPSPSVTIPLYGNYETFFFHYTIINVGTPPLPFTVIVDTGSSDLMIPNWNCSTCAGDPSKFYCRCNSTSSSVVYCGSPYKCDYGCEEGTNQCIFALKFTGVSEIGLLTSDLVEVGALSTKTNFGAIINISMSQISNGILRNKFVKVLNRAREAYPVGILGLAFPIISGSGSPTLLDSLVQSLGMQDMFSLCFNSSGVGGTLTLGSIPAPYIGKNFSYVPLYANNSNYSFYSVYMKDLLLDGNSIGIQSSVYNTRQCITDSGTPTLTLPPKAFTALGAAFSSFCGVKNLHGICDVKPGGSLFDEKCFNYTSAEVKLFPTISIVLDGVVLSYPPQQYLRKLTGFVCEDSDSLGLAIFSDPSGFGTVLGLSVLEPYVTVYDKELSRIGFTPRTNC